jgi:adenylate kinase
MKVVLTGMPVVGMGAQAALLEDALDVPRVANGDFPREDVRAGTPPGHEDRRLLDSGQLVPDYRMGELIVNRQGQGDARASFVHDGIGEAELVHGRPGRAVEHSS